jgi:hypothetical protein
VHAFNSDSIKTKVNGKGAKPQKEAEKVSLNSPVQKGRRGGFSTGRPNKKEVIII